MVISVIFTRVTFPHSSGGTVSTAHTAFEECLRDAFLVLQSPLLKVGEGRRLVILIILLLDYIAAIVVLVIVIIVFSYYYWHYCYLLVSVFSIFFILLFWLLL